MSIGSDLLTQFKASLAEFGEGLTVTRRAASQGGAATTQTVTFIVKPITVGNTAPLTMEGNLSGQEDNAYIFSCAGDEDVKEAIDEVTYNGDTYRLVNVNPRSAGGVKVSLACTGVRT